MVQNLSLENEKILEKKRFYDRPFFNLQFVDIIKVSIFQNQLLFLSRFFPKNESCKRKRNARRVNNALHVKLPFLSLCFLVYFPLRAVLLERLLDRGDRSSLLQREDVFFGRFPVVILLGHCISLFFKPPFLFQSATTKRKEKGQKTLFLSSKSRAKRVCVCVCVCARV